MLARPLQLVKALAPILVTLSGIVLLLQPLINLLLDVSMMALQSLRESYLLLLSLTTIFSIASHPSIAFNEILSTPLPMYKLAKFTQSLKHESLIILTLSDIAILVIFGHPFNA